MRSSAGFLTTFVILGITSMTRAEEKHHMLSGVVHKVDQAGHKVVLETKEGTEHVLDVTEHSVVRAADEVKKGAEATAHVAKATAKKSANAVVHVVEEGGSKTVRAAKVVGDKTLDVTHGVVVGVDHAAHTVLIELENGAKETVHLAKDGVIVVERAGAASLHAVEVAARKIESAGKAGARWVVHFTEEEGKRIAHAWQELTT